MFHALLLTRKDTQVLPQTILSSLREWYNTTFSPLTVSHLDERLPWIVTESEVLLGEIAGFRHTQRCFGQKNE
jgi:hypothetical protein